MRMTITLDRAGQATMDKLRRGTWIKSAYRDIANTTAEAVAVDLRASAAGFKDTGRGMRSIQRQAVSLDRAEVSMVSYMRSLDEGIPPHVNNADDTYFDLMGYQGYAGTKGDQVGGRGWVHRKLGLSGNEASKAAWRIAVKIENKGITSRVGWIRRAVHKALTGQRWRASVEAIVVRAWRIGK